MKPSLLGLLIATGAFGASTIYLAVQLNEERARADEFLAQSQALNARIAELEKARADLDLLRLAGAPDSAAFGDKLPSVGTKASAEQSSEPAESKGPNPPMGPPVPPERSEALQKMMRAQMRANFKRVYADIGAKLGLSKEEANKLIDLMVDQQTAFMDRGRQDRMSNVTGEQRAAAIAAQNEKNLAEVSALIGAGKMDEYKAYQETIPSRQEVEMLSRQLEANDATLSEDQKDRMVAALSEERKRVPSPKMSESVSRDEYVKELAAWQDDYNQRAATRASSILNSEQQTAYADFQQWGKEMRQQMEQRRAARDAGGPPGPPPR